MGRTPIPLRVVNLRAAQHALAERAAAPEQVSGFSELAVVHDDWCMSQKAATHNWCNCEPFFQIIPIAEGAEEVALQRIVESEVTRIGLRQTRDN